MPLYYDPGYGYYGSGGYSSYTPYYITSSYSLYSSPSSSYNRSPVTSNYLHTAKRSNLASSRYKPKLSTISETPLSSTYHHSGLTSLTRIQSPKISPYRNSPKYVAPKPIPINTADIDVSATKYDRRRRSSDNNSERNSIKLRKTSKEEERSSVKSQKSTSDESLNLNNNENKNKSPLMPRVDGTDPGKIRSTIKRDRRVVRLSTVRFKPTSIKEKELKKPENAKHLELPTWRDQLGENQTSMQNAKEKRKNSIEILLEPCIIQSDNNAEDIIQFSNNTGSQIVVEVDPLDPKGVRRLSMTNCPSFHEICEDISSDKIDDDLNAGELRRRASLIQEQEIEILNQLQKSGSGTFHYILERNESQDDCRKSVKRKSTKKGKKVRHKITATVNVENPRLTPILQEVQDDVINTNQTKMSYEVEEIKEEHTVHKIFKLPKKKQKVIKTGSKKSTGSKKEKEKIIENDQHEVKTETMVTESTLQSPNSLFSSKTLTGPEHFTFDIDAVSALDTKENALLSPANLKKEEKPKSPLKSLVPKMPILQNTALKSDTKTTDKIPSSVIENYPKELNVKTLQNAKQAQLSKNTDSNKPESPKVPKTPKVFSKTKVGSSDSGFGELKSPATPKEVCDSVKPKSSIKLQKSESGEDFWSQIGARESLYMVNRRKQLLEQQLKQISAEQETDNEHFESHKKEFNRSESNDSVFSENKIISHDGIKKSSSDNSQLTTNKKTTEINSNKFSDLKQKSEEKQNNQIKQTNKLEKESKISMPAVSQSDCTVETTKTIQPKINSGLLAKIPESKNKQNSNEKFIPSLENKIDIKSSKETNRVEVEVGKSSENVVKKENENTPVDAVKKQNATSPTAINILKNNSNCSASKESGRSDNQGAGAKLKSPPPTDDASVKTTTIKPTTTLAPTVISDNDKNQTKDDYDTKIRTIETGSSKADKTKIIGSLKNSTKRLNDQQTCSEKLLTNTLRENNEELHKTQSSQQQLPPTQTTNEQQEKLKKIIKPTATVADNQKPFETEKTEDITIRSGDNKKQPLFGTNNSDVGSKPATQINQTTIESPPTTITTIKESESKDKGDQTTKFQQSPALSKFATVSDLNRCLLDVDADLSDFIPSEAENSDSSYEEDSNCEEIDENGMKKKNKNGKKKDKDEPAGFNPNKVVKLDHTKKCYVKDEKPPFPLIAKPRPLWKPEKHVYRKSDSNSESDESDESDSECSSSDEYSGDELNSHNSNNNNNNNNGITSLRSDIRMSTCSNDSGFEGGTAPSSPKKMLECDVNCHKKCEKLTANLCGVNQKLMVEALSSVKRGAHDARDSPSTPPSHNPAFKIEQNHDDVDDSETSYTFAQFQRSGHITAPATIIPRFKKYSVEDFHFLAVLGKGSFGKVLLAELRNTDYYYAVKCLKKDVVLQDDDVECTLIERKVLALGTKHPYLCHLFCTFQTESHLFFVMEYLNGGDLMFHIQQSGRFPEERARFYGAEIISGLKFLHKKGIIYRDLKLDNVLLDFDGHVRIADFGMCKLQVYLDRTADTFCGTPDYMAPEIIKGDKYNQNVDWWSFGVLLYEMLIGQSPFSGCDEDELFWSICNELPWFPVFLSKEATSILKGLLEKDATCRIGSQYSPAGDICGHQFFRQIDWHQLERRELVPPFKPQVKHPLDTQYFDKAFTRERVRLTPIDKEILQSMDQEQFQGFSYTNPNATLN